MNPETRSLDEIKNSTKKLIEFLINKKEYKIFTYPNSDPGCKIIISNFKKFTKFDSNSIFIKNFGNNTFYTILKNCKYLIGNSSVGIVESATFKIPVINLGNRQHGKIFPPNVVNSNFNLKSMNRAYKSILSKAFLTKIKKIKNPYGDGRSGNKIARQLIKLDINKKLINKKFIDI